MSSHEILEFILLQELIARWKTLLLLILIEHHLLDCRASLSVKIRELRVLRLYLLSVDLSVTLNDTVPPVHAVDLGEGHLKSPLGTVTFECPQGVHHLDLLVKRSIDNRMLALNADP